MTTPEAASCSASSPGGPPCCRPTWSSSGTRSCCDAIRPTGDAAAVASRDHGHHRRRPCYDAVNAIDRTHESYLVDVLRLARRLAGGGRRRGGARHAGRPLPGPGGRASTPPWPPPGRHPATARPRTTASPWGGRGRPDPGLRAAPTAPARWSPYTPGTDPGDWRPTPPANFARPGAALARRHAVRHDERRPVPPRRAAGAGQRRVHGRLQRGQGPRRAPTAPTRTADQTEIARFWANGAGTAYAAGHWNLIAQVVAEEQGLDLVENARLFALLNIAMADAVIACWDAKYEYNFWRPVTAIRDADTDGNPDTAADPTWTPLLGDARHSRRTPRATAPSAARRRRSCGPSSAPTTSFTVDSDEPAGRHPLVRQLLRGGGGGGRSRLYGGIHWQFDNDVGLAAGAAVGDYVVANFLRPRDDGGDDR